MVTEYIEGLIETYPGLQYLDGFPEVIWLLIYLLTICVFCAQDHKMIMSFFWGGCTGQGGFTCWCFKCYIWQGCNYIRFMTLQSIWIPFLFQHWNIKPLLLLRSSTFGSFFFFPWRIDLRSKHEMVIWCFRL